MASDQVLFCRQPSSSSPFPPPEWQMRRKMERAPEIHYQGSELRGPAIKRISTTSYAPEFRQGGWGVYGDEAFPRYAAAPHVKSGCMTCSGWISQGALGARVSGSQRTLGRI